MAFERDHGHCCLVLPLKLGVGIISMLVFAQSLLCVLALFTGDIRFQANGYNLHTFRLPAIVGSFGMLFGFVGLLGVYDDRLSWMWFFNRFMLFKLAAMLVACVADNWTLGKCDSWMKSPAHLHAQSYGHLGINYVESNPPLDSIAELHVCPWARWAYLIGFSVDFGIWVYFTVKCLMFEWDLAANLPYPIDFGGERHDAWSRWQFYGVKDPRAEGTRLKHLKPKEPPKPVQPPPPTYGSFSEGGGSAAQLLYAGDASHLGPDGMDPSHRGLSASGVGFPLFVSGDSAPPHVHVWSK